MLYPSTSVPSKQSIVAYPRTFFSLSSSIVRYRNPTSKFCKNKNKKFNPHSQEHHHLSIRKMGFPPELVLEILDRVDFDFSEPIDEPDSQIYWCLPASELPANWNQRLKRQRAAWNERVRNWHLLGRPFEALMRHRMRRDWLVLEIFTDVETGEPITRVVPPGRELASKLRHLAAFTDQDRCQLVWSLLQQNSQWVETFFLERGPGYLGNNLRTFNFQNLTFPGLTSFTFRTNAPNEWMQHRQVVQLLRNSPQLQHLTIFQLEGHGSEELMGLLEDCTESNAIPCKLRSLHLRRLRNCSRTHIQLPLLNSSKSLQELTIVLEPAGTSSGNAGYHRGIRSAEIRGALQHLLNVQTLRVADLVANMSDYTVSNRIRPLDDENQALGYFVDNLVHNLSQLEVLEISGTIFSMDLFDVLRTNGCRLRSLSIQRYFQFPFNKLQRQLTSNVALLRLEDLIFGQGVHTDEETWRALESLCKTLGIRLFHF